QKRRADFRDALEAARAQAYPFRSSADCDAGIGDADRGARRRRNRSDYRAAIDSLRASGDIHQRSARNTQFDRLSNSIFEIVLLFRRQEFARLIRDVIRHFHRHKMARAGHIDHASMLELLRDFSGQRHAERIAARAEHYQQRRRAAENSPESVEIARRLVEFCLDLGRAFEFAPTVARLARPELAIVADNLLIPGAIRRLVVEARVHRLDAVENAPALQRPLDERTAPSEFRRGRRLEDYRLDQNRAGDQVRALASKRADRRRAGGMADRPDARPSHGSYKPFEVPHGRVPAIVAVGWRRAVAVAALIVSVHVTDRAQPLCERPVDAAEKSGRVQNHDWRAV